MTETQASKIAEEVVRIQQECEWLSRDEVRGLIGVGTHTFRALRRMPEFPRPVAEVGKGKIIWNRYQVTEMQRLIREGILDRVVVPERKKASSKRRSPSPVSSPQETRTGCSSGQ